MTWSQRAWTRDDCRVHPAAAFHVVSDAGRRTAQPREERTAGASMKVDREIVSIASQPSNQREVRAPPPGCSRTFGHDHFVQMGIAQNNLCGFFLDDVGDVGVWVAAANRANR